MICPLQYFCISHEEGVHSGADSCVKGGCAWWAKKNECCVVHGIGAIAGVIGTMWEQDQCERHPSRYAKQTIRKDKPYTPPVSIIADYIQRCIKDGRTPAEMAKNICEDYTVLETEA